MTSASWENKHLFYWQKDERIHHPLEATEEDKNYEILLCTRLGAVGHTCFYLNIAAAFQEWRPCFRELSQATQDAVVRKLIAKKLTIHWTEKIFYRMACFIDNGVP